MDYRVCAFFYVGQQPDLPGTASSVSTSVALPFWSRPAVSQRLSFRSFILACPGPRCSPPSPPSSLLPASATASAQPRESNARLPFFDATSGTSLRASANASRQSFLTITLRIWKPASPHSHYRHTVLRPLVIPHMRSVVICTLCILVSSQNT